MLECQKFEKVLKKLGDSGSTRRRTGKKRPTSQRAFCENIDTVNDLVLSQEDAPRTHHTTRQIAKETGIRRVNSAPHHSQRPSAEMLEETPRPTAVWGKLCSALESCKNAAASIPGVSCWLHILLRREDLYSGSSSKPPERPGICEPDGEETRGWCWTTDSCARDQLSANRWWCLWRCRSSAAPVWCLWSQAPKSTVSTIRMRRCQSSYWRTFVALPGTHSSSSKTTRRPAHRAGDTVTLLAHATPHFIAPDMWSPNSPDLNPVDYKVWGVMQELDVADLKRRLIAAWSGLQ